jgi:hypothetical protein
VAALDVGQPLERARVRREVSTTMLAQARRIDFDQTLLELV